MRRAQGRRDAGTRRHRTRSAPVLRPHHPTARMATLEREQRARPWRDAPSDHYTPTRFDSPRRPRQRAGRRSRGAQRPFRRCRERGGQRRRLRSASRGGADLYRVYAFGFEVIDDVNTANESLVLRHALESSARSTSAPPTAAARPPLLLRFHRRCPSATPPKARSVGHHRPRGLRLRLQGVRAVRLPARRGLALGALAVFLGLEHLVIRRAGRWTCPRNVLVRARALFGLALAGGGGDDHSVCLRSTACSPAITSSSSCPRQQAGLDEAHRRRRLVGMLLASPRACARRRRPPAALRRLLSSSPPSSSSPGASSSSPPPTTPPPRASRSTAAAPPAAPTTAPSLEPRRARCGYHPCVPLTGRTRPAATVARDEHLPLSATRMAVWCPGITLSDVIFAMDSVPAVLSLTTSPFVLVAS